MNEFYKIMSEGYTEASGPASDEEIRAAEERLGVTFPHDYRLFLSRVGSGFGPDVMEINGVWEWEPVKGETPMWGNAVESTERSRHLIGDLPHAFVEIASDGGETTFYLDTERGVVIAWGPERAQDEIVAPSFSEFVIRGNEFR